MADSSTTPETQAKFETLVEEYGRFLRNTIAKTCPRHLGIDINDIEQEARLRLWRAIENERELTDPASYIYRIAVTTTIDAVRRVLARREEQMSQDDLQEDNKGAVMRIEAAPDLSPYAKAQRQELIDKVDAALARLSENRRAAVELHLQGMTSQEIADLMAWSEAKARNLVYRGMEDLRKQLRAEGIEYEID